MATSAAPSTPLLSLLLLLSLAASAASQGLQCIESFDPETNYFPDTFGGETFAIPLGQTLVSAAEDFTVQYYNSYKVVRNSFYNVTYVLYQCGAPVPSYTAPADSKGDAVRYFEIPLTTFAIDTTVQVPFVQLLGLSASLRAADSLTVDPCIQKLLADGELKQFDAKNATGPVISSLQLTNAPKNFISFDTTTDPGPLKRAEWIKYFALFFNAEAKASQVFSSIESSYQCLNGSAAEEQQKPLVAWVSYYDGTWTLSAADYKLQFTADAGGLNLPLAALKAYDMKKPADVAALQAALKDVDIVIDETYLPMGPPSYSLANFTSNLKLTAADAAGFKFLAEENVWSIYNRNTGSPMFSVDWYEGAVAQPQVVLADLLAIFHPKLYPSSMVNYFYNVAKPVSATVLTASECTGNPTAGSEPMIPTCLSLAKAHPPAPAPVPAPSPPPKSAASLGASILGAMIATAFGGVALF